MTPDCTNCSKCCENIIIPLGYKMDEDMKKWIELHGFEVISGKLVKINQPCLKLENGRCSIYEERPDVCRRFTCE